MLRSRTSDTPAALAVAPSPVATPKKAPVKARVGKNTAAHPSSSSMVIEAITKLGEKKGSSLQAIKKVIADTHKVDVGKQATHIRNALKKLVETGKLTQPKGKGAAGSFKLAVAPKPVKKAAGEKKPKVASPKKTIAKKPTAAKKTASPKKVVAAATARKEKAPKSPKKASAKIAAAPKKGKAPKVKLPKTLAPTPASKPYAPRRAAPKKR